MPHPTATATATRTPTPTATPVSVAPPALSETYAYDLLGNLRVTAGVAYDYPAAGQARPHAPIRVGGQPSAYDANGNLVSGGGRTFTWNGWNQLASVSQSGVSETYAYDAEGERVTRTTNGVTVVTLAGMWERTIGGATTHYYQFHGQVIGLRQSDSGVFFLHGDHLGSVSAVTNASGALTAVQHDDPWGRVRASGVGQTALNVTGQLLNATGLLYYHARYYDPALGRFMSPDSIVPGAGALTLVPHDAGARQAWAPRGGVPDTPQELNRSAYARNNPLRYTDLTGHAVESADIAFIAYELYDISQNGLTWENGLALAADVGWLILPELTSSGALVRAVADAVRGSARVDDIADAANAPATRSGEMRLRTHRSDRGGL